ncbi:MAG: ankyrin repeat domain-containing protein [Pseudomonadota bacterium]
MEERPKRLVNTKETDMDSRTIIRFLLALVVLFLANGCASLIFGELNMAARDGDMAKVKTLVESDPACVRGRGGTAISAAASGGHLEIVRYLLSKGADVNVHEQMRGFESMTPLLGAATRGNTEVVRFLIENGADVNSLPGHASPLFMAAYEGRREVAELLIAKGADVNVVVQSQSIPGGTPLHAAVAKNHVDLVNLLLRNGANVNARQNNGTTPLEIALKNRNDTIATILKTHGTVVREKPKEAVTLAVGMRPSVSTINEIGESSRFIVYDNGTVLDTRTYLMWAARDNGSDINWANAKSYCENYRGGGYSDWRMPTQDELGGLYNANKARLGACNRSSSIHVATELIDITCFIPWASETRGSDAAYFNFGNGERYWGLQSYVTNKRALPVRSGK